MKTVESIKERLEKHRDKVDKIKFGKITIIIQDGKAERIETSESLK